VSAVRDYQGEIRAIDGPAGSAGGLAMDHANTNTGADAGRLLWIKTAICSHRPNQLSRSEDSRPARRFAADECCSRAGSTSTVPEHDAAYTTRLIDGCGFLAALSVEKCGFW
jgi:hypothetical protein